MRIYQSENGEYIVTDDNGIKARGITENEAKAAFYLAGGKDDPIIEEHSNDRRRNKSTITNTSANTVDISRRIVDQ